VVIPCHNEALWIAEVVHGARKHLEHVWVVDDGSADGSSRLAQQAGAHVLRHERRRGKGAALATGWRAAAQAGLEWVILMDGDGQHLPEDLPVFLDSSRIERLLVGNRMSAVEAMPWLRRWANRGLSQAISRLTGRDFPDSQCGFRRLHLPSLNRLELRSEQFEIESELCVAFARAGFSIGSVPVQVRYGSGVSKINPLADGWRWYRWYLSERRREAVPGSASVQRP
jgi:glycosyltransferase involved in cell wall biosynthesis